MYPSKTILTYAMCSGHAQITVTHGHLNLEMEVTNDGTGRPQLLVSESPDVSFEGLKIKVWGSKLAPLYNFIAQIAQVRTKLLLASFAGWCKHSQNAMESLECVSPVPLTA